MQVIQHSNGVLLGRVEGHVMRSQMIRIEGKPTQVNSYHNFGTTENAAPFEIWAVASDGVIKGIRDLKKRIVGIMWHPERLEPFSARDRELVCDLFGP
jgi:putative glutamine amidotransferase